jgi:hypothetical protein
MTRDRTDIDHRPALADRPANVFAAQEHPGQADIDDILPFRQTRWCNNLPDGRSQPRRLPHQGGHRSLTVTVRGGAPPTTLLAVEKPWMATHVRMTNRHGRCPNAIPPSRQSAQSRAQSAPRSASASLARSYSSPEFHVTKLCLHAPSLAGFHIYSSPDNLGKNSHHKCGQDN